MELTSWNKSFINQRFAMSNRGGGGTKKEASKMKIKPFPVRSKIDQFCF